MKGTFLTTQAFIRSFGGEGTIINLVSLAAVTAFPGMSSYASSKLAQIKLGQAIGLGQFITLCLILPLRTRTNSAQNIPTSAPSPSILVL